MTTTMTMMMTTMVMTTMTGHVGTRSKAGWGLQEQLPWLQVSPFRPDFTDEKHPSPSILHRNCVCVSSVSQSLCKPIGADTQPVFVPGIWTCAALETINVSGNQIADDGMLALGRAMEGCVELTRLDLSKNVAGDRGGEELAGLLLKCCPRLEVLDVRDNRFSDAAAERMRGVLRARTRLVALIDRTDKGGARPVPSSWSSL
eukprot:2550818-Rhodomonas_salina.3